jgi:hypothetical protein
MDEVRFSKGPAIGSALLLAFALILGSVTRPPVVEETIGERSETSAASSAVVPPPLASSEGPGQPVADSTIVDKGQELPGEPVNALREGYSAYRMRGILGRVGFGDGIFYVENRNRFEWRDVRVVLDEEATHDIGRIPPAAVRGIAIDTPPRDVRVFAAGLDTGREAVLAFAADGIGGADERDDAHK